MLLEVQGRSQKCQKTACLNVNYLLLLWQIRFECQLNNVVYAGIHDCILVDYLNASLHQLCADGQLHLGGNL